jgi:cyclase
VALGGAGSIQDLEMALQSGAHASAAGSLFIYKGPHKAVLINYPTEKEK